MIILIYPNFIADNFYLIFKIFNYISKCNKRFNRKKEILIYHKNNLMIRFNKDFGINIYNNYLQKQSREKSLTEIYFLNIKLIIEYRNVLKIMIRMQRV